MRGTGIVDVAGRGRQDGAEGAYVHRGPPGDGRRAQQKAGDDPAGRVVRLSRPWEAALQGAHDPLGEVELRLHVGGMGLMVRLLARSSARDLSATQRILDALSEELDREVGASLPTPRSRRNT